MSYTTSTNELDNATNQITNLLDQGSQILDIIEPVASAELNYMNAYANYQKALEAYNKDNFFGRLFNTGVTLKKAKEALTEAETAWQNISSAEQADKISDSSSSILSYWPLFAVLAVALIVVIVIVKRRK